VFKSKESNFKEESLLVEVIFEVSLQEHEQLPLPLQEQEHEQEEQEHEPEQVLQDPLLEVEFDFTN
jgi:hypothetical protein